MTRKPRTKAERHQFLGNIVERELAKAEGADEDAIQANRAEAMKYYLGHERGDEAEGRSRIVSTDVADAVNATLAMMRDMLIKDAEITIDADGEDDEVMARAEADILSDVLMKDNPGELEILEAVKDGLILKNGCLKVQIDETIQTERLDASNAENPLQVAAFVDQVSQIPGTTVEVLGDGDQLRVTNVSRRFLVNAVPIENISYQAGFSGQFQDLRFFAERIEHTRSDLVEMGIDKATVDALPAMGEADNSTATRRNQSHSSIKDAETRDQDIIDCHEAYVRVDMDGDGISERYRVLVANRGTCLEYEEVDLIPYSLGSPFVSPHRLTGESLFDRLKETQDANTALQRQLIDNVTVINNGRVIYDPSRTSEEDVLTPKAGGGIRSRDPGNAVVPVVIPDVTGGILAALDYNRRQRSEKVGAALDMASAEAQIVNKSATAASIEKGNQELMSTLIASNFAMTLIRGTYSLLHELMRMYATRPYNVRVAGQTQQIDPRQWKKRTRFNIRCGVSPTERAQRQMALGQHLQLQAQAMQAGMAGILASPETIYRTSMEWLALHGIQSPERHAIDPQSPQAQEAAQRMAQAQQAAQDEQRKLIETQVQLEFEKLRSENLRHKDELNHKYYDTDMDAEIATAKITGQGVIDLEKQRLTNESNGSEEAG